MKKYENLSPEAKMICHERQNQKDFLEIKRLNKLFRNRKFKNNLTRILICYDTDSKEWLLRSFLVLTKEEAMFYFFRKEIKQALEGLDNPCKEVFLKHFR